MDKHNVYEKGELIDSTKIFGFDSDEEIMLIKCPQKIELNFLEPIPVPSEEIDIFLKTKLNNDVDSPSSDYSIKEQLPIKKKIETPTMNKQTKHAKVPECAGTIVIKNFSGCKIPTSVRQQLVDYLLSQTLKLYPAQERATAVELVEKQERAIAEKVYCVDSYRNLISGFVGKIRKDIAAGRNKMSTCDKIPEKSTTIDYEALREKLKRYVLSSEELFRNGFPVFNDNKPGHVMFCSKERTRKLNSNVIKCSRCVAWFDPEQYYRSEPSSDDCVYHPGRRYMRFGSSQYSCCSGTFDTPGCSTSKMHVHDLCGEVTTGYLRVPECSGDDCECGIYGLDCEMVYTTKGLELARVTMVDHNLQAVYDSFVVQDNKVVDYNTRFSGITEEHLRDTRTTFKDAQNVVLSLLCRKTILVGHSLENDLISLKIAHETVVDTSVMFPHRKGPPYKRALRNLSMDYLGKVIQNGMSGHDSLVDAATCIELIRHKVEM